MSDRVEMEREFNRWQDEREGTQKKNPSSYKTRKCPKCGANIEVTEFEDGSVLIRRDCVCDLSEHSTKEDVRCLVEQRQKNRTDVVKSSQLGFEVPEK